MNGFCADHADGVILADDDLLADEMTRVNAADGFELKKAVAVIMHDHEADFVHVGIEQNTQGFFCRAAHFSEPAHCRAHPPSLRRRKV